MKITAVCLALFIGTAAVAAPVAAQEVNQSQQSATTSNDLEEAIQDCVICCIGSNHHNNTQPRECVTRCREGIPVALETIANTRNDSLL